MSCGLSHRPQTWFSLCSCGSTVRLCRTVYVEDVGLESWVSEGRYLLHKGARLSSEGSLCTMLWTLTTLVCVGERERERERESVWVCVFGGAVGKWVSELKNMHWSTLLVPSRCYPSTHTHQHTHTKYVCCLFLTLTSYVSKYLPPCLRYVCAIFHRTKKHLNTRKKQTTTTTSFF